MPTTVLYQLNRLRCRFLPAIGLALAFALAANFSWAALIKFNIPAQATADALILFSKQSGMDVLFAYAELKRVKSVAVQGSFEPNDALVMLLQGTGYTSTRDSGKFVVAKAKVEALSGALRGALERPDGRPAGGVRVNVRGTAFTTMTDERGQFYFAKLPAGVCVVVARAAGFQPLHIVDVAVPAGGELSLNKEVLRTGDEVTKLDPYMVRGDPVTELERYSVYGERVRPFEGANVDIPRTINDAQPYTIFDAEMIERTAATNVEDFLKQRLTMNTASLTSGQKSGSLLGNTSQINLRGLGGDKTLILVNGRRMPGVFVGPNGSGDLQPDLNGIPMSAIDRIEVLPTSASGIYGGSALGGVVNVILKQDYTGGEARVTYDNTFDADAPRRTAALSYGRTLEGGKTHVMFTAQWSDAEPLLLQDRREMYERYQQRVMENYPSFFYSSATPFLGALANITAQSSSVTALTLKDGTVLPSRITHVPAGTSPTTSAAELAAGLAANAGEWSFDLPASTLYPTGLLRTLGAAPRNESYQVSLRRQMTSRVEAFVESTYTSSVSRSISNPIGNISFARVPADAPTNPFTTAVTVRPPVAADIPWLTESTTRSLSAGLKADLPFDWIGQFDYSWSENRYSFDGTTIDSNALNADLASGVINPFVDVSLYPIDVMPYISPRNYSGTSRTEDYALRGAGPLIAAPWGDLRLAMGLEHRVASTPENEQEIVHPFSTYLNSTTYYLPTSQQTDSAYAELSMPLVPSDGIPGIRALELQLSGRSERFTVDTGTRIHQIYPDYPAEWGSGESYSPAGPDGGPFTDEASYTSTNGTVGLKYEPFRGLTVRTSLATAFLPPSPAQLVKDPVPNSYLPTITDPQTGLNYEVQMVGGGNPDLKPQNSKSWNVGVIWEPQGSALRGLRLNVEYYQIKQFDAIDTLSYQSMVDNEEYFPSRVTRDSAGLITLLDLSALNLFGRDTAGWDLNVDYRLKTSIGTFNLSTTQSSILYLEEQYSLTAPVVDLAPLHPASRGGPRYRRSGSLTWAQKRWSAGWSAQYWGSYAAKDDFTLAGQGSDRIPSQIYHDAFASYDFGNGAADGRRTNKILSELSLQIGVRNVFNTAPPMDANYYNTYLLSPYGDTRLRSYWITLKKKF